MKEIKYQLCKVKTRLVGHLDCLLHDSLKESQTSLDTRVIIGCFGSNMLHGIPKCDPLAKPANNTRMSIASLD